RIDRGIGRVAGGGVSAARVTKRGIAGRKIAGRRITAGLREASSALTYQAGLAGVVFEARAIFDTDLAAVRSQRGPTASGRHHHRRDENAHDTLQTGPV